MLKVSKRVNPKFAKYFGVAISRALRKAKTGDFDTLWNLLPFMVLAAELYADPEAREGLEFLMSTVNSGDDLLSWVDYLALPADGWEGDEVPPVDAFSSGDETAQLPLSFLFAEAHAQRLPIGRVSLQALKRKLLTLMRKVKKGSHVKVPAALKAIREELQLPSGAALRKMAFKPEFLIAMTGVFARSGMRNMRNFLKGKTNARYSPATILGTIAYIEWEAACGRALEEEKDPASVLEPAESVRLECNGIGFDKTAIRAPLHQIYAKAFADVASGNLEEETPGSSPNSAQFVNLKGGAHGAFFHLNQLAYFQVLHRFAGGRKVKGIERGRWLWFYRDEDDLDDYGAATTTDKFKPYRKNLRFVDIVLEESDGRETWVELKSLQAASPQKREEFLPSSWPIDRWNIAYGSSNGKKSDYNRQYLLDQTAGKVKHARLTKAETEMLTEQEDENAPVSVSNNYQWRFQKFKIKHPVTQAFIYSPRLGSGQTHEIFTY